jgi:polyphosphate kinase
MSAATAEAMISIGDRGILNAHVPESLRGLWMDRDLSWIDFNERVLAEALDERTPLLERAKFLAIYSANLDEFFMKRIAVLRKVLTPERIELLTQIREKIVQGLARQADCYRNSILPGLARNGIHIRSWEELTHAQQEECSKRFDDQISPALTPIVIEPAHKLPFLSNLSTSLAFALKDTSRHETMYARVKVPAVLKQWISLKADVEQGQTVLAPLHEVIQGNIQKLYSGMELSSATLFRITRDAEVDLDDDDPEEDKSEIVKEQVRLRRYEPVVRLEFAPGADASIRAILCDRFALHALDVYDIPERTDFNTLFELLSLDAPQLRDAPWTPVIPGVVAESDPDIFAAIRDGDILLHHPYESFDATVEHFVAAAAHDPQTVAIKMTAYRIGDDTPFVKSLVKAAESGKQVACVIELMARFDEERNLHWAAELQGVGAHVTFGMRGLKTHAKTILVVRKEQAGLRAYVHIGTGNYHVRTAKLYADVGLMTCDPVLTRDAVRLFHYLTGHSQAPDYEALLVAPVNMRTRFLDLVRREQENQKAGRPSRIVAKVNQLEDPALIQAVCDASQAGVPVNFIIRGFCCLRPEVPGRTEGIHVRSIIGRFLEHSRIYHFANGHQNPVDGDFFIGSADWMDRNLSRRVEVVTPIYSMAAKEKLWEILQISMDDKRQAWVLHGDGAYAQLHPAENSPGRERIGTHQTLMDLTRRRAHA